MNVPKQYRQHDHTWMLTAWVLPLAAAAALTAVSGGLLAITLPLALAIGIVATAMHLRG